MEQVEHLKRGERRQKHVDQHHGRVQGAPLSDPEQRQTAVLVRIPEGQVARERPRRRVAILRDEVAVEIPPPTRAPKPPPQSARPPIAAAMPRAIPRLRSAGTARGGLLSVTGRSVNDGLRPARAARRPRATRSTARRFSPGSSSPPPTRPHGSVDLRQRVAAVEGAKRHVRDVPRTAGRRQREGQSQRTPAYHCA